MNHTTMIGADRVSYACYLLDIPLVKRAEEAQTGFDQVSLRSVNVIFMPSIEETLVIQRGCPFSEEIAEDLESLEGLMKKAGFHR